MTAYGPQVHNVSMLAEPQEVFTFVHPNRECPIDNTRTLKMCFDPLPDLVSPLASLQYTRLVTS
eukprot:961635-Pyramimonas_sp.AAC.1